MSTAVAPSTVHVRRASRPVRTMFVTLGSRGGIGRAELLLEDAFRELVRAGDAALTVLNKQEHPRAFSRPYRPRTWNAAASRPRLTYHVLRSVLIQRPDTVVFSHVNLAQLAPIIKALRPETHVVTVVHGLEVWGDIDQPKRLGLQASDTIWSPSAYTERMLTRAVKLPPGAVSILPWSLMRDAPLPPPNLQTLDSDRRMDGRREILSVTRLDAVDHGYKGVGAVLKALPALAEQIPNVMYTVIGDGSGRGQFEALAARLGVEERVRFLGLVSDDELERAYQRASVFALPSEGEGFGLVFLEAMAAGCPVVAADAGATPEVVVNGVTGLLVDPRSVPALKRALETLLVDNGQHHRLRDAGRRHVAEHFTFDRFVERTRRLLRASLTRRTGPRNGAAGIGR